MEGGKTEQKKKEIVLAVGQLRWQIAILCPKAIHPLPTHRSMPFIFPEEGVFSPLLLIKTQNTVRIRTVFQIISYYFMILPYFYITAS
jgi:hypothetical protein